MADLVVRGQPIQRKAANHNAGQPSPPAPPDAGAPGTPLDPDTRGFMEPRFGFDFGRVRVHTDAGADAAARSISARAYTLGDHVVFARGQYSPNSPDGRRLLAHELTHTIQQRGSYSGRLQRDKNASVPPANTSSAATPPATPAPPPGDAPMPTALKTVTYQGKEIYGVPDTAKQMLQTLIAREGWQAAIDFLDKLSIVSNSADETLLSIFKGQDLEAARLCVKTTLEQRPRIEKDRNEELASFEKAALEKTKLLLDQSEKRVNDERVRYGIPEQKIERDKEGQTDVTPHTMANNDDTKAMAAAAGELVPPRKALEALLKRYDACLESTANNNQAPGLPAKRVIVGKEQEAQELDAQIKEARGKLQTAQAEKEAKFPILAMYHEEGESKTTSLENIAKGTASQGLAFWRNNAIDELVPMVHEKLYNITKVRMALSSKDVQIWSHATIVTGTKAELGYNPHTWQNRVVDDRVKEVHDKELFVNLLVGAVAIGLGLVAIFATAGTATAAVAAGGSAVLSGGQAAVALGNYLQANAESGTDFDKSKAISQEDPSLFWLAVDLIAAGLDLKAAVTSFKALAPAIREALAVGKSPESLGKLGKILDKFDPAVKQKVLLHVTGAKDVAQPTIEALEKSARAQYKSLAESGRLKEIGDITEEAFVQQMISGARSGVIASGGQGIRRGELIIALMQPGNERIAAILKGELKAIDDLIREHGNWKQLLGMLNGGTPEMRQAADMLFKRRQNLLPMLERDFHAKPVSGASTEKISDIDLSTYGDDAGQRLIDAEKHMQAAFGPGWSEALRMNFYTEAGRLTLYDKLMPGLSKADQAATLAEFTGQAEKLNVAKMLAHAQGNPARIAEVEAYAAKIGVDVKDPKILELVPKLADGGDVASRNKLLLEIDELMKKYRAAPEGSREQLDLAKSITSKQMEANAFTAEAYIGPGAGRMTVSGIPVVGHEAYQATLSNLEMIQHIMHEAGGDIVAANREYEIYKYINRFAEAAENAGAKTDGLDFWKHFSGFVSKTERGATSTAAHVGDKPTGVVKKFDKAGKSVGTVDAPVLTDPTIGPVSDQLLQQQYQAWKSFSEQAIADVKKAAEANPSAWSTADKSIPTPRPAAGTPALAK